MPKPLPLDSKTIEIVKASVPFLAENGEKLTRLFYQRMFEGNPETKAFFNEAHQRGGSQQRALAGAICAYAMHIDNPGALSGAIGEIAEKHVALGVQSEHYPIVGKHLLGAIRELLGEAASDDLMTAWEKAFYFLASVFVSVEGKQYADQKARLGGWNGRRPFRVTSKVIESEEITSFHLTPEDNEALPAYLPGQYITVFPSGKNPSKSPRNYSLSHRSGRGSFRISVKEERALSPETPPGAVSTFLHAALEIGDQIELGPPCGVFHLNPEATAGKTIVLLSAGVGQTPVLAMLHALAEAKTAKQVLYIHIARNGRHHAFREEVETLQQNWPALTARYLYARPEATDLTANHHHATEVLTDSLWQEAHDDKEALYYFCGSKRFMKEIRTLLTKLGVPEERQYFEFFGPKSDLNN